MGKIQKKPTTRRDAEDRVRLKTAGIPAHINPAEDDFLKRVLPEAAGRVVKSGLLAEAGRRGDDRVTKLIPAEAALLKSRGGSGTVNPASGLLEFSSASDNGADSQGDKGTEGDQGPGGSSGPGGQGVGPTGHGADSPVGPSHTDSDQGFGLGYRGYDRRSMPSIESLLNAPNNYRAPGYEDLSMMQYSPPDTFGRLFDTYRYGPPPSYTARGQVPGRYDPPSGRGPGIMGTITNNLAGSVLGMNPMSMAMSLGMHFDQAMSPETRAASLKENQERGAVNSGGRHHWTEDPLYKPGAELRYAAASAPGARSGAETEAAPVAPAGYTINPAGQIVPGRGDRPPHQDAIKTLLYDYIWRGPSGRGWA